MERLMQQQVVPALRVRRYASSRDFYAKLGFSEQWTHQFEPGFPVFASIVREGMQIFLTEHTGDCAFGGLVHFYVADVDACYAEFMRQGVAVASAPGHSLGEDLRDMLIVDTDGNRLIFITILNDNAA